jgi:hypothetical protein
MQHEQASKSLAPTIEIETIATFDEHVVNAPVIYVMNLTNMYMMMGVML